MLLPQSISRQRSVVMNPCSAHCSLLSPLSQGPAVRICFPGCHLSQENEILFQWNTVVICLNQDSMTLPRSLCLVTGRFQDSNEVLARHQQFSVCPRLICFVWKRKKKSLTQQDELHSAWQRKRNLILLQGCLQTNTMHLMDIFYLKRILHKRKHACAHARTKRDTSFPADCCSKHLCTLMWTTTAPIFMKTDFRGED